MARYMRTDLGRGHTNLGKPIVVGAGIAWHGPGVYLTYPSATQQRIQRRGPHSRLAPPAVIRGARVNPGLRVKLTFGRRGAPKSHLSPPAVVTQPSTEVFSGPPPTLAPQRRGRATYDLAAPIVVDTPVQALGWIGISLAPQRRGQAKSFRGEPVVSPAAVQVYYGPTVTLVPQSRGRTFPVLRGPVLVLVEEEVALYELSVTLARVRARPVRSVLRAPAVVGAGRVNPGLRVKLAFGQRRRGVARLRPPAVVTAVAVEIYYGPSITLAPSRRAPRKSFLRSPAILQTNVPTAVTLAPQRRGAPHSVLQPPRAVFLAVEIYGPERTLVRIKPPQRFSILSPPAVITQPAGVLYPVSVNLTYSRRLVAKSVLRPPVVVGAGRVNPGLRVKLTFGRRPVAKSRLFPPVLAVVVAAAVYYGPQTSLTRIRPRRTRTLLQPPAVIRPDVSFDGPGVLLTRSSRGRAKSILRKPVAVTPVVVVYFGPQVTLRPQRRGQAKYFLRKPVVVAAAPAFKPVIPPWLTYSRRGRPIYFLREPVVVFPFRARPTAVLLAPQSRGRPVYRLFAPQVVRLAVEIYGPETWLTYSRRGRPSYRLEPPAVLGKAPFRGIQTWLTRIKPRPTVSLIKPPTVVRIPTAGLLQVHLTYSRRGRPISFQIPFTPGKAPFRPVRVYLTRIKPRPTVSLIKPPSVVGAGIAFFGPSVTLVRITPPPVQYNLRLTLVAFRRPGGDVCGFDIATTFVCSLELPGSQVSGTDAPRAQITGSSRAANRITGSESAGGSVSGSDRKAT